MGGATLLIVLLALTGLPGASVGAAIVLEAGLSVDARIAATRELRTLSEQISRVARRFTGRTLEAAAGGADDRAPAPSSEGLAVRREPDLDALSHPASRLVCDLLALPPPTRG